MAKDTENIILQAARKQFLQNGFAATRMQQIADEAGINKAMLHYYFRSKDKLFQEILVQIFNTILPKLSAALEHQATVLEKIEKIAETYIHTIIEHPDIPFFIMSELSQQRESFVAELKKRGNFFPPLQAFMLQMNKEMQEGKIRQIAPMHLLLNVLGMCLFPFIAKPIFCNLMNIPDPAFEELMKERVAVVVDFVSHALRVD